MQARKGEVRRPGANGMKGIVFLSLMAFSGTPQPTVEFQGRVALIQDGRTEIREPGLKVWICPENSSINNPCIRIFKSGFE